MRQLSGTEDEFRRLSAVAQRFGVDAGTAREQGFEVTAKELAETIIKMRPESRPYLAPYLALSALEGEL